MPNYQIENKKDNTAFVKKFASDEEAKHWIINNLDLSLDWYYTLVSGAKKKPQTEVKEK